MKQVALIAAFAMAAVEARNLQQKVYAQTMDGEVFEVAA